MLGKGQGQGQGQGRRPTGYRIIGGSQGEGSTDFSDNSMQLIGLA